MGTSEVEDFRTLLTEFPCFFLSVSYDFDFVGSEESFWVSGVPLTLTWIRSVVLLLDFYLGGYLGSLLSWDWYNLSPRFSIFLMS